jgi:hypothetical protein
MASVPHDKEEKHVTPDRSPVILLLATAADTTWRMFVPIIGLTVAGLWGDKQLHTTPWLMIIGIIIGVILAALLVWRQLQQAKKY